MKQIITNIIVAVVLALAMTTATDQFSATIMQPTATGRITLFSRSARRPSRASLTHGARGESKRKAMFHPTQKLTLDFISRVIKVFMTHESRRLAPYGEIVIADTSVGEGHTLAAIRDAIFAKHEDDREVKDTVKLIGIEPNIDRVRTARSKGIRVLHSTLEQTQPAMGVADMVIANPPYDMDNATGKRLEVTHLPRSFQYLRDEGLFVYIIQRKTLSLVAHFLATYGYNVRVSNYAPEEAEEYDQIVVWCNKKIWYRANESDEELAQQLVDFSSREIEFDDLDSTIRLPYRDNSEEIHISDFYKLYVRGVYPTKSGRRPSSFMFTNRTNSGFEATVNKAHTDGLLAQRITELNDRRFRRAERLTHRGIRKDQLAAILGVDGIGNFLPALFKDPRDNSVFQGILRVSSEEKELVERNEEKGTETIKVVQNIVSNIYNTDSNSFIKLGSRSEDGTIGQQDFLAHPWNHKAILEIVNGVIENTFFPPSLDELVKNSLSKTKTPRRLASNNFYRRPTYNQHITAVNAAELLKSIKRARLNVEQGGGKSTIYPIIANLINAKASLLLVPPSLVGVLALELANTLKHRQVFSIDTETLKRLRLDSNTTLPRDWRNIIKENYGNSPRFSWIDKRQGEAKISFSRCSNIPDAKSFRQFAKNELGNPLVKQVEHGAYRLIHDYNPVSEKTLQAVKATLPQGSAAFIEHSESIRVKVPSGANQAVINAAVKAAGEGAKANKMSSFTEFRIVRDRAVSRDPEVYLLRKAKEAAQTATADNPVFVISSFTALTLNHRRVSSLQTWRALEQRTIEQDDTMLGEKAEIMNQVIPPMLNSLMRRPSPPIDPDDEEDSKAARKHMRNYKFANESRFALACPDCLETLRAKHKNVPMLERPDTLPYADGIAHANAIDGKDIAGGLDKAYLNWLEKIAVKRAKNSCKNCGAKLYASFHRAATVGKKGVTVGDNTRLSAIEYIASSKMRGVFDLAIFDESHMVNSPDSARGIAAGKIAGAADKVVYGSATSSNGYAEDNFWQLFNTLPEFREEYDITDKNRFQEECGYLEQTRFIDAEEGRSATTERKTSTTKSKKQPGVKSAMAKWMLPYSVSMKLHDVKEMCDLREYMVAIELEPELRDAYKDLLEQLSNWLFDFRENNDSSNVGRVVTDMRTLGTMLLDAPYKGIERHYPVSDVYEEHKKLKIDMPDPKKLSSTEYYDFYCGSVYIPPMFQDRLTNKERKYIEIVEDALKRDPEASGLLFAEYTGKYNFINKSANGQDLQSRIEKFHERKIKTAYLGDNVATVNRTPYIDSLVESGTEVLMTNPEKVAVGVTLNYMRNIVFFQSPMKPSIKAQAARRSYRINQDKDIEVYMMFYEDTVQELSFALMQNKDAVDRILSGEVPAIDEKARDIRNSDDALLMLVRQQVLNSMKIPEELKVKDEDTSLLLTRRSNFIGDEDYVYKMSGVSNEEWVDAECRFLRATYDDPFAHAKWLGFTPPAQQLAINAPIDVDVTDTTQVTAQNWFSKFDAVPMSPTDDAEEVEILEVWAQSFFNGDADRMMTSTPTKKRKRMSKEDLANKERETLDAWLTLVA